MQKFSSLISFILLLFTTHANGHYDNMQFILQQQYPPQIRYDNILLNSHYLVSGGKNHKNDNIILAPGEEVAVRMDNDSILKLYASDNDLSPEAFEVKVSNGTGVYLDKPLCKMDNSPDLILIGDLLPGVAKIKLKSDAPSPITLAIFVSRFEPIPELVFYPSQVDIKHNYTRFLKSGPTPDGSIDFSAYMHLNPLNKGSAITNPDKKTEFTITGPSRLELNSIYSYSNQDDGSPIPYIINVKIDDLPYEKALFLAYPDYNSSFSLNPGKLLSYPSYHYVNIPEGKHKVSLTSDTEVLVQIHKLEDTGYLFAGKNGLSEQISSTLSQLEQQKNFTPLPSRILNQAIVYGENNFLESMGLQSYNLIKAFSYSRRDDNAIYNLRNNIADTFTTFMDLLPSGLDSSKEVSFNWSLNYELLNSTQEWKDYKIPDTHLSKMLDNLLSGYYVTLGGTNKLQYTIPKLSADSDLRLIVQQHYIKDSTKLYVQYDNEEPKVLSLYPQKDTFNGAYKPNYGIIGLDMIEHEEGAVKLGTASGAFAQNHTPAFLVSAGYILLPLPKDVSQVSVWGDKEMLSPIKVALQCRYPISYSLPTSQIRAFSDVLSKDIDSSALFTHSLRFFALSNEKKMPITSEGFINYLRDQKALDENTINRHRDAIVNLHNSFLIPNRFLYERYQKYIAGTLNKTDKVFLEPLNQKSSSDKELDKALSDAFSDEKKLAAIQEFSQIIESGNPNEWREAQLARAKELIKLGQSHLAEKSLRAMFLGAKDLETKNAAYDALKDFYLSQDRLYNLEGLISSYLILVGNDENKLTDLAEVLFEDSNQKLSSEIASLIKNVKPSDRVVFAWIKATNGTNSSRPGLAFETKEEKHFWNGQELQTRGRYKEAKLEFDKAGEKGKPWAEQINKALSIRQQFNSTSPDKKQLALQDWQNWLLGQPGPKFWERANYLIDNYYQVVVIYSFTEDKYENMFVSSKKGPLRLKVAGPIKIKLNMRPILTAIEEKRRDIWVNVTYNGESHKVRLDNSVEPNAVKLLTNNNSPLIGLKIDKYIELNEGVHYISVEATGEDVAVVPEVLRPILAITALPPMTYDNYKFLSGNLQSSPIKELLDHNKDYSASYTMVKTSPEHLNSAYSTHRSVHLNQWPIDVKFSDDVFERLGENEAQEELPLDQINKLLFKYQKSMDKGTLVKAMNLCNRHKGDYEIEQSCNSFSALSRSSRLLILGNSEVPLRKIAQDDLWSPDSESLIIKKNLIAEDDKDSYVLTDASNLVLNITEDNDTKIKIKTQMMKLIVTNPSNAEVGYQIDSGETQKIEVSNSGKEQEIELPIKAGKHSLRLSLIDPKEGIFVKINLLIHDDKQNLWKKLIAKTGKEYFVVPQNKQLKFKVAAPSWIEVRRLVEDNKLEIQHYFIEKGEQEIILEAKESEGLYRIYERLPSHPKRADMEAQPKIDFVDVKEPPKLPNIFSKKDKVTIKENLHPFGQSPGTWGFGSHYVLGLASDTITPAATNTDPAPAKLKKKGVVHFLEECITYRQVSQLNRTYFRSDFITRQFLHGSPSYGLKLHGEYITASYPLTLFVDANGFTQRFNQKDNYGYYGDIGMRNLLHWSRTLYQITEISFFASKINYLYSAANPPRYPDPELYTNYNKMRYRGLNGSYTVSYFPWLDSRVWGGISYSTNTKYRGDNIDLKAGVDQLIYPFTVGFDYSHKKYIKGDGRKSSFVRETIGGHIKFDHWLKKNNRRLEFDFNIAKVYDSKIPSNPQGNRIFSPVNSWVGSAGVNLHLGVGRGYRDFKADEIEFLPLKEKLVPVKNEVNYHD